ncbi:MAG: hypothetical protein E3J22_04100 [Candidatus Aminicenantes bacterium]|nr:MAG: hypothetical protein E3J22_04100 [Candidatus Aminicenantes bacterium]
MRKHVAAISLLAFVLFISSTAYPNDSSADFSLSKNNEGFSLSKTYEVTFSSLELNSAKLREAMLSSQDTRKTESIQAEIKHLKKRKTTNLIATTVLVASSAFLMNSFINYEEGSRESQEGGTQEVEGGASNTSFGRGILLGASVLCVVISVVLVSDTFKKSKAIKQYKKELEALAEAQGR